MSDDQLTTLLGALTAAPALPGARCRGKHHLFDEASPRESATAASQRHNQAAGLCQHCPSKTACETWYTSLPAHKRPSGVVAGRIPGTRRAGRPRREEAS